MEGANAAVMPGSGSPASGSGEPPPAMDSYPLDPQSNGSAGSHGMASESQVPEGQVEVAEPPVASESVESQSAQSESTALAESNSSAESEPGRLAQSADPPSETQPEVTT